MSDQIRLLFLGTGAAIPSLRRRLPALALILDGRITLCDCSEATQMRLQKAGLSANRVRNIFISHMHGDHIFGLPGLITSQHLFKRTEPLHIFGPPELELFLACVQKVTQHHLSYSVVFETWDMGAAWTKNLDDYSVEALPLDHGVKCCGFRFVEHDRPGKFDAHRAEALGIPSSDLRTALLQGRTVRIDGKTVTPDQVVGPERKGRIVAYCTDTRPSANSVALAKDADVLVHESTFHPDESDLARETGHSTSTDAAEVARAARVGQLYLYHISGRQNEAEEIEMTRRASAVFPQTEMPDDYDVFPVLRRDEK